MVSSRCCYTMTKSVTQEVGYDFFQFSSVYLILVNGRTNENIIQSVRETTSKPFGFQIKQPPIVRMKSVIPISIL